jgi:hypothetical protein
LRFPELGKPDESEYTYITMEPYGRRPGIVCEPGMAAAEIGCVNMRNIHDIKAIKRIQHGCVQTEFIKGSTMKAHSEATSLALMKTSSAAVRYGIGAGDIREGEKGSQIYKKRKTAVNQLRGKEEDNHFEDEEDKTEARDASNYMSVILGPSWTTKAGGANQREKTASGAAAAAAAAPQTPMRSDNDADVKSVKTVKSVGKVPHGSSNSKNKSARAEKLRAELNAALHASHEITEKLADSTRYAVLNCSYPKNQREKLQSFIVGKKHLSLLDVDPANTWCQPMIDEAVQKSTDMEASYELVKKLALKHIDSGGSPQELKDAILAAKALFPVASAIAGQVVSRSISTHMDPISVVDILDALDTDVNANDGCGASWLQSFLNDPAALHAVLLPLFLKAWEDVVKAGNPKTEQVPCKRMVEFVSSSLTRPAVLTSCGSDLKAHLRTVDVVVQMKAISPEDITELKRCLSLLSLSHAFYRPFLKWPAGAATIRQAHLTAAHYEQNMLHERKYDALVELYSGSTTFDAKAASTDADKTILARWIEVHKAYSSLKGNATDMVLERHSTQLNIIFGEIAKVRTAIASHSESQYFGSISALFKDLAGYYNTFGTAEQEALCDVLQRCKDAEACLKLVFEDSRLKAFGSKSDTTVKHTSQMLMRQNWFATIITVTRLMGQPVPAVAAPYDEKGDKSTKRAKKADDKSVVAASLDDSDLASLLVETARAWLVNAGVGGESLAEEAPVLLGWTHLDENDQRVMEMGRHVGSTRLLVEGLVGDRIDAMVNAILCPDVAQLAMYVGERLATKACLLPSVDDATAVSSLEPMLIDIKRTKILEAACHHLKEKFEVYFNKYRGKALLIKQGGGGGGALGHPLPAVAVLFLPTFVNLCRALVAYVEMRSKAGGVECNMKNLKPEIPKLEVLLEYSKELQLRATSSVHPLIEEAMKQLCAWSQCLPQELLSRVMARHDVLMTRLTELIAAQTVKFYKFFKAAVFNEAALLGFCQDPKGPVGAIFDVWMELKVTRDGPAKLLNKFKETLDAGAVKTWLEGRKTSLEDALKFIGDVTLGAAALRPLP